MRWIYETGIETPNIFDSGSSCSAIITTYDFNKAFNAFKELGRNYLVRRRCDETGFVKEWYDEKTKEFIKD